MGLLSPMDAFRWFERPRQTFFAAPAPGTQLVAVEPRRVSLIISLTGSPDTCQISAVPVVGSVAGILLSTGVPFIAITQHDHGPLCQWDWYVNQAPAGGLCVVEVLLREWPLERM